MSAFSKEIYRDLKMHGTKAELVGCVEDNTMEIRYFGGEVEKITIDVSAANVGGHMGGDYFMMNSLYKAWNGEVAEGITYLDVSIESHLMIFSAEESRMNHGWKRNTLKNSFCRRSNPFSRQRYATANRECATWNLNWQFKSQCSRKCLRTIISTRMTSWKLCVKALSVK